MANSVKFQYLATLCVNFMAMAFGASCGWPSPSLPFLKSKESHLSSGPISTEEASWIIGIFCIGGLFGNLFFGWLTNIWGRKRPLCLLAFPNLASWILITFATNIYVLLFARFLAGFAGGGVFVLIPLYVAEISEDRVRGALGSTLVLSCNFGMLIAFVFGNYLNFIMASAFLMVFPIIFLIGFSFLPETPQYLIQKNRNEEAEYSLRFYRNLSSGSHSTPELLLMELQKLKSGKSDGEEQIDDSKITWKDFSTPAAKRAFLISIVLMGLNQFCGCFAMLNYTATIFEESGSSLSPNMAAIVVGVIQLVGSYCSTLLVERAGRKMLLLISCIGTGIGLATFGTYSYVKDVLNHDVSSYNWIPVFTFSFVIFIVSWGLLTLPFIVVAEILPEKVRAFGATFCLSLLWSFMFIAIKYFPMLTVAVGMHGSMFIFTTVCFAGAGFLIKFMPETKGRSFNEIQKLLGGE